MTGEERRESPFLFVWRNLLASEEGPPSTTRLVLLALSLRMDTDGASCFPSVRSICVMTGLSNRAVIDHLDRAEREGWIRRESAGRGGQGWRRHRYTPLIPAHLEGGEAGSPRSEEGGEPHAGKVVNEVHSTSSYTSSETKRGESEEDAGRGGAGSEPRGWPPLGDLPRRNGGSTHRDYPEEFESIWSAYPRSVGKGKAYRAARARVEEGVGPEDLRQAAERYAVRVEREETDRRYIQHASTFYGPTDAWLEELDREEEHGGGGRRSHRSALDAYDGGGES